MPWAGDLYSVESDMTRPTILVTGAANVLGYEMVRLLTGTVGANVIIHAPTQIGALNLRKRLIRNGARPGQVDAVAADFTRLSEVAAMARIVKARHRHLDVLINNADGAAPSRRRITEDGNEMTFQVNYLAPYLLTRLLIERLTSAPDARVVYVSTNLHRTVNIDWADPQRRKSYSPAEAYAQSKLALTMFSRSLAAMEPQISAVSINPWATDPLLRGIIGRRRPVTEGAGPIVHLCTTEMPLSSGAYYEQLAIGTPSPLVENHGALGRLWRLSSTLAGLDHARASARV
jgi:NAD(P)-dependent dehydrogenase (short-subunit alcohol dehydrogenase family)